MEKNKVINLHEYRQKRTNKNKINLNKKYNFKEDDDRKNTFNLFMRVLETIRQESY